MSLVYDWRKLSLGCRFGWTSLWVLVFLYQYRMVMCYHHYYDYYPKRKIDSWRADVNKQYVDEDQAEIEIPYDELKMEHMTLSFVEKEAAHTKSYHDFFRIFYKHKNIPDSVIDEMLGLRIPYHKQHYKTSKHRQYTRQSYTSRRGRKHSLPLDHPAYYDMQSDEPVLSAMSAVSDPRGHGRIGRDPPHQDPVELLDQAQLHYQEMENRTLCRIPREEVVCVSDIATNSNSLYFPRCTIVYRCAKSSGCCDPGNQCQPKTVHTIPRVFYKCSQAYSGSNEPGSDFVNPEKPYAETLYFENHTECECRPIPKPITPPKQTCTRCPRPFIWDAASSSCTCGDNQRCRNISLGRKALGHDKLVCIKNGKCDLPLCIMGSFDVSTGFCPRVEPMIEEDHSGAGSDHDLNENRNQRRAKRRRSRRNRN